MSDLEALNRSKLREALAADFETFEEVWVRHALFRRRRLRIDVLAVPRHERLRDIALGFEVKGHPQWDISLLAQCLKQSSDYVLATVDPELVGHAGKHIMAVFIYPPPPEIRVNTGPVRTPGAPKDHFFSGMVHMAGYLRVGSARVVEQYREKPLGLWCPDLVWTTSRGWRTNARDVLAGKRQIGSQRFAILEELVGLRSTLIDR